MTATTCESIARPGDKMSELRRGNCRGAAPSVASTARCADVPDTCVITTPTAHCECGAASVGVGKGARGHSPWCPWS